MEGNKRADLLTKKGAKELLVASKAACELTYQSAWFEVRVLLRKGHQLYLIDVPGPRQLSIFIGSKYSNWTAYGTAILKKR